MSFFLHFVGSTSKSRCPTPRCLKYGPDHHAFSSKAPYRRSVNEHEYCKNYAVKIKFSWGVDAALPFINALLYNEYLKKVIDDKVHVPNKAR